MNRRNFIRTSSVVSSAAFVSVKGFKSTDSSVGTSSYYLARSGNFKKDDFYLLGVVSFQNPTRVIDLFNGLKQTFNYRTKLSYNSNDKYKVDIAKGVIDLFVNENIEIICLLEGQSSSNNLTSASALKIDALKRLLGQNFADSLVSKNESYFSPSTTLREDFGQAIGGQMLTERTDDSVLLQFSDLINGCIFGAISGKVTNPIKLEIISYFQNRIGVFQFTKDLVVPNKIRIV